MYKKLFLAFGLVLIASPGHMLACGVDTSSARQENSNSQAGKVRGSQKKTQPANLNRGIALTDQTVVQDDRWEKVKARLNKPRTGSGN